MTWPSVRTNWVQKLVIGEPSLLLFRGEFLQSTMRRTRVTEEEVRTAVRAAGLASFDDAEAVVLETDASFSVIERRNNGNDSAIPRLSNENRP
ncbi:MAG: YetF domain-containing protein [Burkholderiales bacterium]